MINRPLSEEYGDYYETYISKVPEGNLIELLAMHLEETSLLLTAIPDNTTKHRYAPGKWSLIEVIGHILDTERIMDYRLLRIARGDKTPLAGFDQDAYISGASFDSMKLSELAEDYVNVRRSTITLLRSLPEEAWSRSGVANNKTITARALAYIIAGHELHHLGVIRERYL